MRGLYFVTLMAVVPVAVGAQTTPWGDPDLQGVWTNKTSTALQRPAALGDQAFFTEEEATELERTSFTRLVETFAQSALSSELELSGEISEVWLETDQRVTPSRRTSLVDEPPNGRIPYTTDGQRRWDALPTMDDQFANRLRADGPEDRTKMERCGPLHPLLAPVFIVYKSYHQIFQTPDHVAILSELRHQVRIVSLDQRQHADPGIELWEGDSRGWWEDQTLVVETTNFSDKSRFRGATEHVRTVERFTRLDADTIEYRLTVTDPATFTQPWSLENALRKTDGPIFEDACHEGNYSMTGILAGARAAER